MVVVSIALHLDVGSALLVESTLVFQPLPVVGNA